MNLASCDNCGVVVDLDNVDAPPDLYSKEDGSLNDDRWRWNGEKYIATFDCPVCQNSILMKDDNS